MQKLEMLEKIANEICCCEKCPDLVRNRLKTVPGEGNPNSPIVFLGEGPGKNEAEQGRPFVGRAGELLNNIIIACGWKREDVFILNVVKCRPENNREPTPEEAENCRPFLELQLKVINPKIIVCLGGVAAKNLLKTQESVGNLRGQWHELNNRKCRVTYHPSFLLRNPHFKEKVWEDMQVVKELLEK